MTQTSDAQRLRLQLVAADFVERMGARIRERRESMGLKRPDLARLMSGKVNENAIYRWETGKHQPMADTLEELARVLECDVAYFMAPEPEESETPDPFADEPQGAEPQLGQALAELQRELSEVNRKLDALTARLDGPGEAGSVIDVITQMLERAAEQQPAAQSKQRQRSARGPRAKAADPRRAA